jgi:hypothetical protein
MAMDGMIVVPNKNLLRQFKNGCRQKWLGSKSGPAWLLDELTRDDWWIRAHRAYYVVSKIDGLEKRPQTFY